MATEIPSEISVHDLIASKDRRSRDSRRLTSRHQSWLDSKELKEKKVWRKTGLSKSPTGLIIGHRLE